MKFTDLLEADTNKLQDLFGKSMDKVDKDLSYKDLAKVVANIIKDDYGTHNIKPFMDELQKNLK